MRLSRSASVIVDVGAYIGIYSLVAAAVNPRALVFGFEPVSRNFEAFEANCALNATNVTPIRAAVGDRDGFADLFLSEDPTIASLGRSQGPVQERVPVCTLKTWFRDNSLDQMDLMKIDVETFEPAVLAGMGDLLGRMPAVDHRGGSQRRRGSDPGDPLPPAVRVLPHRREPGVDPVRPSPADQPRVEKLPPLHRDGRSVSGGSLKGPLVLAPQPGSVPESPESARAEGRRPRLLVLSHVLPCPGAPASSKGFAIRSKRPGLSFTSPSSTCAPRGSEGQPPRRARTVLRRKHHPPRSLCANPAGPVGSSAGGDRACAEARREANELRDWEGGVLTRSRGQIPRRKGLRCRDLRILVRGRTARVFQQKAIPCVLDMHNILWRPTRGSSRRAGAAGVARRSRGRAVPRREEQSWRDFDGLVAINREEEEYVRARRPARASSTRRWASISPVGRTGGSAAAPSGSASTEGSGAPKTRRARSAATRRSCRESGRGVSDAELWLVGTSLPPRLQALTTDPRVKVTGFVRDVGRSWRRCRASSAPGPARYGFRSRLVEVMSARRPGRREHARPCPGMELEHESGILLADDDEGLARLVVTSCARAAGARDRRARGRARIETLFTVERPTAADERGQGLARHAGGNRSDEAGRLLAQALLEELGIAAGLRDRRRVSGADARPRRALRRDDTPAFLCAPRGKPDGGDRLEGPR